MEVIPEYMRSRPQPQNKGPKKDDMTSDKEPSAAENFLVKSTRCIKDATSAATSSSGMETVLLTDLKYNALIRRINR
jgi:hypothetical protein